MTDPKTELAEDDYHIAFGLHSGFPLCCVFSYVETPPHKRKGDSCKVCKDKGIQHTLHTCDPKNAACETYLDLVKDRAIKIQQNKDKISGQPQALYPK
jgi:hypothetical protein